MNANQKEAFQITKTLIKETKKLIKLQKKSKLKQETLKKTLLKIYKDIGHVYLLTVLEN